MARQFDVPDFYQSPIIGAVKAARRAEDPRKKDLAPSILDFGPLRVMLARHFGFCFGVENAIEVAYRALKEHPEKAQEGHIFLLSEMIHNPHVNSDLQERGIRFLRTTSGEQLISFDDLGPEDLVIIPAFGTTREIEEDLHARGIDTAAYDTTCPFVKRVWKRSSQIGDDDHTIVVHGKRFHEETRATFSHAESHAPVVVVRDLEEADDLADVVSGRRNGVFFRERFADRISDGFDPEHHLQRIGVVNQTTMLATETAAIAERLRQAVIERDGDDAHFADTSDTLCYATKENQDATLAAIETGADLAIVVGGYNSSNTSHLVDLCRETLPTYFISGEHDLLSTDEIRHFIYDESSEMTSTDWLPQSDGPATVFLTAGASCPDALLDTVVRTLHGWFPDARPIEEAMEPLLAVAEA